jgi:type I restriction enzyme S subunit
MIEWKEYKLESLAEITSSKRIFYSDYVTEGIPFFRSKEIIEKSLGETSGETLYITREKYFEIKKKFGAPENGDLLISAVGERAGIPYVVKNQGDFYFKDGNLIWFRNINPILNIDYFYSWLKSNIGQMTLESIMIGSAQKALTIIGLKNLEMPLPPLPEQKAIASVLLSIDHKIDLLHIQNKTLESIAELLFKKMFEKYFINLEDGKHDWRVGKIEELFILQRGFDLPIQSRVEGKYPIFAASGFSGGHQEFRVKSPGVTTGRSGLLGKVFFILEDFWPLNTSLFIKEFKIGTPLFSYFILKSIDLESFNAGSAVPTLNRNHVHEYEILIPPVNLIQEFENLMFTNFKKIKKNQIQIQTLEKMRDTLLPKLMSGEVRIEF